MLDQVSEVMEAAIIDEKFIPNIARMMKRLFDELVKAGFNEEQAASIVANYKLS